jgi:heme/copper-type cytochrome/quinol oxidase subunit 3
MSFALVRPDAWDVPLLLHVAGAMVLVGSLATVLVLLVLARRGDAAVLTRLAFRTLLLGALPGFVVMRAAAEWIFDKENVPDDVDWVGIGFGVSDFGLLLLIIGTVLCGLAVRRLRRAGGEPGRLAGVTTALIALMLVGYGVAIWAMTTKPGA